MACLDLGKSFLQRVMAVSESRILITNMLFVETIGFAFQQVTASTEPHFVVILVVLICRVIIFPARHEPFFDSISALPSAIGTTRSSYHMPRGQRGTPWGLSAIWVLMLSIRPKWLHKTFSTICILCLDHGSRKAHPPLDSGDCFQSLFVEATLVILLGWYLNMQSKKMRLVDHFLVCTYKRGGQPTPPNFNSHS